MENKKFCAVMVFVVIQIGRKQTNKQKIRYQGKNFSGTSIEIGIVSKNFGMVRSPCRAKSEKVTRGQEKQPHLHANHLLWDVHHSAGQPALQTLGKVADGLS